ncbi:CU044_2847 family protein [Micromonospora sp. DT233]|uniref:CU044_2847 family protein n=1 Tax=Micromonospora sp. DT233 TaxID=3393432 RepID=UPI003CECF874
MSEILVAVQPKPGVRDLKGGAFTDRLTDRLDDVAAAIETVAVQLRAKLDTLLEAPAEQGMALDGLEIKFTIELQADAGVVIAKASTKAGIEATLTWSRQRG